MITAPPTTRRNYQKDTECISNRFRLKIVKTAYKRYGQSAAQCDCQNLSVHDIKNWHAKRFD